MVTTKIWVLSRPVLVALIGVLFLTGCTPPGARALLDGKRLMEQGQHNAAVEKLRVAVQLLHTNAQAWNHLGLAYHRSGVLTSAAQAYQRALLLDPNLAVANYNLGCLQLEQGNLAGALASLTTYSLQQPASLEGRLRLATAQYRARQLDAADRSFREALQLQPNTPEALNGLALVQVQRRRYLEARSQFQAALQIQPRYGPALLNLALLSHHVLNQRLAALERYREYASIQPAQPLRATVLDNIRRLEQELQPVVASSPARGVTNPPPVATVASNLSAIARPTETNLLVRISTPTNAQSSSRAMVSTNLSAVPIPDSLAAAAKPSRQGSPQREFTNPPPEEASQAPKILTPPAVVQVDDEPLFVAAKDQTLPVNPPADVSGTSPPRTNAISPPRDPAESSAPSLSLASDESQTPPQKKSLLKRLNPVSWFSGGKKEPTPLPASEAKPAVQIIAPEVEPAPRPSIPEVALPEAGALARSTSPNSATPLPARPPIPRYAYAKPAPGLRGDRALAAASYREGQEARQDKRWLAASEAFEKATRLDPSFFEAHFELAAARDQLGHLSGTLLAYENALALDSNAVPARYNFGLALLKGGYANDAARELEKVLEMKPDLSAGHLTLAGVYAAQLFQKDKARQHYLKLLELEPQHPQASQIRVWLAENP